MLINTKRLQEKMDDEDLDVRVAATLGNVFYFTGLVSDGLQLFPYEHQS